MTPLIDTLIGIVFVFLIFSLITSWAVEYVSLRWNRRGDMLYKYLARSLDDHLNLNLGVQIYHHPLILQLSRVLDRKSFISRKFRTTNLTFLRRLPMYIPSDQFAAALIDVVADFKEQIRFEKGTEPGEYKYATDTDVKSGRFERFRDGVMAMKESDLKRTLVVFIQKANAYADVSMKADEALEQVIISWYENGMDRMAGWYKRATRKYLVFFGFLAAILFNVDTVKVVKTLWADPKLRGATAEAAANFVKENPDLNRYELPASLDLGRMDSVTKAGLTPGEKQAKRDSAIAWLSHKMDSTFVEIEALGLPVGWANEMREYNLKQDRKEAEKKKKEPEKNTAEEQKHSPPPSTLLTKPWLIFPLIWGSGREHLLGWIITALALSFGSSFWFDVLKKFVNVRSAGLRPKPQEGVQKTK